MNKKLRAFLLLILVILLTLGINAHAAKELSGDEIKVLITNKTFTGFHLIREANFKVHAKADGSWILLNSAGKIVNKYWMIHENKYLCVAKKKGERGNCSTLVDNGDGSYKRIFYGEHKHTLSHFVDGNQLK